MLQTSSNQRDSHRLSRASVTNVVNLRPKTLIFSEKAVGLTTFVTTDQKSTRKTPPIDDVCNNTQRSAPKSQHDKPDHIGGSENQAAVPVGGGEAWPGFEATRRATHQQPGPTGAEGPEGPEGQTAVPMGGGGAWPGFETTHRTMHQRPGPTGVKGAGGSGGHGRASRRRAERSSRRGRLAGGPPPTGTQSSPAPQAGPPAPETPAGHSNKHAYKNAHPEPGGRI